MSASRPDVTNNEATLKSNSNWPRLRMARATVGLIAAIGFLMALPVCAPMANAQQSRRVVVSSIQSCATCRIEVSKPLTLGSERDSLVADVFSSVARTRQATYLAATLVTGGADHIRVYGRDGRFVQRVGRKGEGPGEYRSITHVTLGRGDSILVFQPYRLSVLTPQGSFARLVSLPFSTPLQAVVTARGEIVVTAQTFSRRLAGLPVHRLSSEGQLLGSFGADPAEVVRDRPSLSTRRIALGPDGQLWLARPDQYEIEQWTVDGQRVRTLSRHAEWFPPRNLEMYSDKPTPYVVDLRVREDGSLWVLSLREGADWQRFRGIIGKMVRYSPIEQDGLYDSMVEVIEPESGRLVSTLRLPFRAGGFVDSHHIWGLRETDIGLYMIDIWQLTLNRNEDP